MESGLSPSEVCIQVCQWWPGPVPAQWLWRPQTPQSVLGLLPERPQLWDNFGCSSSLRGSELTAESPSPSQHGPCTVGPPADAEGEKLTGV